MAVSAADSNCLFEILESAGVEVREYSGSGMYGAKCIAFDFERPIGVEIADLVLECFEDDTRDVLCRALRAMRTDSMGRGQIAYFPGFTYPESAK